MIGLKNCIFLASYWKTQVVETASLNDVNPQPNKIIVPTFRRSFLRKEIERNERLKSLSFLNPVPMERHSQKGFRDSFGYSVPINRSIETVTFAFRTRNGPKSITGDGFNLNLALFREVVTVVSTFFQQTVVR